MLQLGTSVPQPSLTEPLTVFFQLNMTWVMGAHCAWASVDNSALWRVFSPSSNVGFLWLPSLAIATGQAVAESHSATATQQVTIEDTLPPTISCNSPASITPPDAPIAFAASAQDQCAGPLIPVITAYDCFQFTKSGRRVDKTDSCQVAISGDTVTILDSGGVSDTIEWTVEADDGNGNTTSQTCSLVVVNPGA